LFKFCKHFVLALQLAKSKVQTYVTRNTLQKQIHVDKHWIYTSLQSHPQSVSEYDVEAAFEPDSFLIITQKVECKHTLWATIKILHSGTVSWWRKSSDTFL